MLYTGKSHSFFGHKISEILILEEIKDLISFGFKDITFFKKNKDSKINYYFSNPIWEKLYIENDLFITDPCTQALLKTNALIVPWETLPQKDLEFRKKTCQVRDGLSIQTKKDKDNESFLLGHLGTDEAFMTKLLSSKESLETLFLLFKKISEHI
ncbi:MAG: hypothetical protein JSS34_07910 [Proteobacteria bacterium]|nr:hypothetical protein [Pseudomonadota bacterium]